MDVSISVLVFVLTK